MPVNTTALHFSVQDVRSGLQKLCLRSWLHRYRGFHRRRHWSHAARRGGPSGAAGEPVAPAIGQSPHGAIGLHGSSRRDDIGLGHEIMCRMLADAGIVASGRSISVARLATPASAPDRGCCRAGRGPPPNSTRHRRSARSRRASGLEFGRPVRIGRNVWIGAGAIILPGVSIADDAQIGAGSVVTRDVPAGATAFGNPARVQAATSC
jgi:Hexapeptide repeat of succinyl-transferase